MPREPSSTDAVNARNVTEFLVILAMLVLGFVAITQATGIDIVTVGPLYMFTPAIAGLLVCLHNRIVLQDVGLRIGRRRWLALAAVLPLPVLGTITALSIGVPGVMFDSSLDMAVELGLPSGPFWTLVALGGVVAIGATVNAVGGFGEEFGWRGYLLWELAPLGFWKASLAIGTVWGVWHAPLIVTGYNYPSFPIIGVFALTTACIAMTPLFIYIVIRSESVLPAAIFHGVFNAVGLVGYAATDDAVLRQLVASEGGVIGVTVFGLIAVVIALTGTPHLSRDIFTHRSPDVPSSDMQEMPPVRESDTAGEQ